MPEPEKTLFSDSEAVRRRLSLWTALLKADVDVVESAGDVADEGIREQLVRNPRVRGWQSESDGTIHVYLPGLKSTREVDNVFMHDVVAHRGLHAMLGMRGFEEFLLDIWGRLYDSERRPLLTRVGGDPNQRETWLRAASEYVGIQADRLADPQANQETARRNWNFVTACFFRTNGGVARMLQQTNHQMSALLAAGIRHARRLSSMQVPDMPKEDLAKIRDMEFSRLEDERWYLGERDMRRVFHFGYPGRILMSCSPRAQRHPIQLRVRNLFGVDKQDRHPYSFNRLKGLCRELDEPLAVFDSKDVAKPKTIVVLTRLFQGEGVEKKHFVVPLTPSRNADGKWVNNIDSIYPKQDLQVVHWLVSKSGLVRYLAPDFEKRWLEPVKERVKAYYEDAIAREGDKKRTESNHLPYADELAVRSVSARDHGYSATLSRDIDAKVPQNSDSASDSGKNLTYFNATSLMEEYAMAMAELELATEKVRSFVNPPIPREEVRMFQDFTQRPDVVLKEKNALSLYNYLNDEEKLRSIADGYRRTLMSVIEKGDFRPVHAPRMLNGNIVSDSAALTLRLRMLENPQWTPYFLPAAQARAMSLKTTGEPTAVVYYNSTQGTYIRTTVYNLANTDYKEKYPSTYESIMDAFSKAPTGEEADMAAIMKEALQGDCTDRDSVREFLTGVFLWGACGKTWEGKPDAERVMEELSSLGDDGIYRMFESVGTRMKAAVRDNHLLPQKAAPIEEVIRAANREKHEGNRQEQAYRAVIKTKH